MELNFSLQHTFTEPQSIKIDKVATLIGENGSGKSSVLHSIFTQKLSGKAFDDHKIICFSSGQNEKFSHEFLRYMRQTRSDENNLQLSCFYFDKSWSRLLIFLATALKQNGRVRQFLIAAGYADEVDHLDNTSMLKIVFRVDTQYVRQVQDALNREARGDMDTVRQTAFHRTLESFIENCIQPRYDFDEPIKKGVFDVFPENLLSASFDTERLVDGEDLESTFDPEVGFFIRACHNENFLDKEASSLIFKNGLELGDLSDGEFQILFLYAIIDLFDSEDTLFIFDEADSHLHFKNVEKFWSCLKQTKGNSISTTHLLDSIYCVGVDNIRILNRGKVCLPSDSHELIKRLSQLTNIKKSEFKAFTYYEKIVLIDDDSDWFIFKELYKRSKAAIGLPDEYYDNEFEKIAVVKLPSSWNTHNCRFAESKLGWVNNFISFCDGQEIKTKNIYLLCDRDNLPLDGIGTEENPHIVQGVKVSTTSNIKINALAWRRREIKHYLLSYTALGEHIAVINNGNLPSSAHLRKHQNGDYLLGLKQGHYLPLLQKKMNKEGTQTEGKIYNDFLALLRSDFVKNVMSPFTENLDEEPYGFSRKLTLDFISTIPPEEISEDITNMYKFIIGKL